MEGLVDRVLVRFVSLLFQIVWWPTLLDFEDINVGLYLDLALFLVADLLLQLLDLFLEVLFLLFLLSYLLLEFFPLLGHMLLVLFLLLDYLDL